MWNCTIVPDLKNNIQWDSLTQSLYIACAALSFKDGSTALFKAAFNGHNGVVEELLKFSPSLGLLKVEHQIKN